MFGNKVKLGFSKIFSKNNAKEEKRIVYEESKQEDEVPEPYHFKSLS